QAVFILGHQQILHIVLTLAFGSTMTISTPAHLLKVNELWQHSLVSATASEVLLDNVHSLNEEKSVAFTASLLHDIGKLVLGQTLSPAQLAEILDLTQQRQIPGTAAA